MARSSKPSKGRKLTDAQKIAIAQKVCDAYATGEFTLESCLKKYGVKSFSTWYIWEREIEEIKELYKKAIEVKNSIEDFQLVRASKSMLRKWVEGFDVTEEKKEYQGRKIVSKTVTVKKKHSLTAVMYVLNNKTQGEYSNRPQQQKGSGGGLPFTGFRFIIGKIEPEE